MSERILTDESPFLIRETDFRLLRRRQFRLQGGAIIFCTSGRASITLNMQEHEFSAEMEMIVIPDSTLMISRADKDFRIVFFYFTRHLFEEAHRQIDPSFFHHIMNHPVYCHARKTAALVRCHFFAIQAMYNDHENRYRTAIVTNYLRSILLNVYDKIQRETPSGKADTRKRQEELYEKFIELIHRHCTRHRQVEFYADKLCISKRYLAAITREIIGETPKFTIDKHIVQEIKILLAFSDISLPQIAETLQFPDQSYLGRYFKRYTGQSLRSYRSKITSL